MLQARTWQRRKNPRLATWYLRRWLVLLLVLAFSTSGLAHGPTGDHSASAASPSHETASVGEDVTAEPDCAGDVDEAHGATCCTASVCSFGVPLISSAAITRAAVTELLPARTDEFLLGRAPSPGFRPPSLSANA